MATHSLALALLPLYEILGDVSSSSSFLLRRLRSSVCRVTMTNSIVSSHLTLPNETGGAAAAAAAATCGEEEEEDTASCV